MSEDQNQKIALLTLNVSQLLNNQLEHKEAFARFRFYLNGMIELITTFFSLIIMLLILSFSILFFAISLLIKTSVIALVFKIAGAVLFILTVLSLIFYKFTLQWLIRSIENKVTLWMASYPSVRMPESPK